jgi:hypothetical protein
MMSITLELPADLETMLAAKAQHQGLSVPDLLLQLARKEAENVTYTHDEIDDFLAADALTPELSYKVQELLRQ